MDSLTPTTNHPTPHPTSPTSTHPRTHIHTHTLPHHTTPHHPHPICSSSGKSPEKTQDDKNCEDIAKYSVMMSTALANISGHTDNVLHFSKELAKGWFEFSVGYVSVCV